MSAPKRKFTANVKKKLGGAQSYRKWSEYAQGDTVLGKFVGYHTCQYKKKNPKIEVYDAQWKDADAAEKILGRVLVLNHCAKLEKLIEEAEIEEGDGMEIEYEGTFTLTKGPYAGKESHTMTLSVVEIVEGDGAGNEGL